MRRWHAEWALMRTRWRDAWAIQDSRRWGRMGRAWAVPAPPDRAEREAIMVRHAMEALRDGPPASDPWFTPPGLGIAGYGRYRKRKPFSGCGCWMCDNRHDNAKAWRRRPRTLRRAEDE